MRGIEVDPERADRPGRGRRARRSSWARRRSAHGLSSLPGSSPDVGVDRLHARRRPQLARPPLRLRLQPRARRSSWSPPTASRARSTPRTTPTSSGRCAAVAAATRSSPRCTSTCCRSPRSTPAPCIFPAELGAERGPRLPRLGRRGPRRGHLGRPLPHARRRSPTCPSRCAARPLLTIDGACIGSQAEGEAAIAPLREIGEPIMDTFDQMPAAGLCRIHMDPENPVPGPRPPRG